MIKDDDEHDRLLLAIARDRDRTAFAALFAWYAPRLKAYLKRGGATTAAAEDFAQDAMLTVWRRAELYNPDKGRAATWIYVIARNKRLDALRQSARPLSVPELELQSEAPELPDDQVCASQDADQVRAALARLKPEQQQVLRLAFFLDHPHSEVARQLALPLGTVKTPARRGLLRIREMLAGAKTGGMGVNS